MDPRFQPQNNSSSPQNPSGYPQANPYNPQGTNSGPNIYPTLPPVQNHQNLQYPQYNHGPQQNYPPQQYPQYNPAVGGQPGYLPPSQYGNPQYGQGNAEHMERMLLNAEMKELEGSLESGHLQCYTIWSCIVISVGFCAFLRFLVGFFLVSTSQQGEVALCGLGVIWLVFQSYFSVASKYGRSLAQATVACWMVCITLLVSLFFEGLFGFIWFTANSSFDRDLGQIFTSILTIHLLVHILVNMIGAFKVRSILVKRGEVEMKLAANSFNNQV